MYLRFVVIKCWSQFFITLCSIRKWLTNVQKSCLPEKTCVLPNKFENVVKCVQVPHQLISRMIMYLQWICSDYHIYFARNLAKAIFLMFVNFQSIEHFRFAFHLVCYIYITFQKKIPSKMEGKLRSVIWQTYWAFRNMNPT